MKKIKLAIGFLLLGGTACLSNGSAQNQTLTSNASQQVSYAQTASRSKSQTVKLANSAANNNLLVKNDINTLEDSQISTPAVSAAELKQILPSALKGFRVVDSYKPFYLKGDFDGDKNIDIAIVVEANDKSSKTNQTNDSYQGLCQISNDISVQNVNTKGFAAARAGRNCSEFQSRNLKLKNSPYALFIVLSQRQNWKTVVEQKDAFGKKFLLLDAVFKYNYENKKQAPLNLQLLSKNTETGKEDCVSPKAKGDSILSGEAESAALAIYFDKTKFVSEQCGD